MKNTLYVSVVLMIAVWVIVHFAYRVENAFVLLIMAAIIVFIRLAFNKKLDRY